MTSGLVTTGDRLDPAVVSVIFAPRSHNYTLLSVTTEERFSELLAVECFANSDQLVKRRIFENLRRAVAANLRILPGYFREYFGSSYLTATLTLPPEAMIGESCQVPAREFPFASQFNFLVSPEEGLLFDPDDIVER